MFFVFADRSRRKKRIKAIWIYFGVEQLVRSYRPFFSSRLAWAILHGVGLTSKDASWFNTAITFSCEKNTK